MIRLVLFAMALSVGGGTVLNADSQLPAANEVYRDYYFLHCLRGSPNYKVFLGSVFTSYRVEQNPGDPNYAHNTDTGQNFVWDGDLKTWIDAKSGVSVCPGAGAVQPPPDTIYRDYFFIMCLHGAVRYEVVLGSVFASYAAEQNLADPNYAHNADTGQNFIWDTDLKAWIDAKTGVATCPAPSNTGPPPIQATKLTDDGIPGTLRVAMQQAIAAAGGGIITFASGLTGTIVLQSNLPTITTYVTIIGPGGNAITISGNGRFSGLTTASPQGVFIYGLTITGAIRGGVNVTSGSATLHTVQIKNSSGSGIRVLANANLNEIDCTSASNTNTTIGGGGLAIDAGASAYVTGSTFTGNNSTNLGGAIFNSGVLTLTNSVITDNVAGTSGAGSGGGLWATGPGATVTVVNSYFQNNKAGLAGGAGFVNGAHGKLYLNTFDSNIAGSSGGGIYYDKQGGGVVLAGNLLYGDTGGESAGVPDLSGNLVLTGNPPFATIGGRKIPLPGNGALGHCPAVPGLFEDVIGNYRTEPDVCGNTNPAFTFAPVDAPDNVTPGSPFTFNTQLMWLSGQSYTPSQYPLAAPVTMTVTVTGPSSPNAGLQSSAREKNASAPKAAQLGPYTVNVDSNGHASVPLQFTQPGTYTISMTGPAGFLPASYSVTAAGTPAILKMTAASNSLTAAVNTVFSPPLQVLVADAAGNAVGGVPVTFSAPTSGASGTFEGFSGGAATAVTNGLGLATAPYFTANGNAGSYTVTAASSSLAAKVTFNLTNIIAPALRSGNPVLDAITNRPQIVGGSWMTAYGANFSDITKDWSDQDFSRGLPTSVAGVQVLVNGTPAPVWYVAPGQVNFQAPTNISGTARVAVARGGVASSESVVTVVSSSPGVISYSADYATYYPSAQFAGTSTIVGDPTLFGSAVKKAVAGDQITAYVTGLAPSQSGVVIGSAIPFQTAVTIGIGSATVSPSFVGQIGPGYYQMNFTIPAGLAPGNYAFTITVNGVKSQANVVLVVGP